jgi:hypothetical protein
VIYKVQFFVNDTEVKSIERVDGRADSYAMSESEYGDGGYGVKV